MDAVAAALIVLTPLIDPRFRPPDLYWPSRISSLLRMMRFSNPAACSCSFVNPAVRNSTNGPGLSHSTSSLRYIRFRHENHASFRVVPLPFETYDESSIKPLTSTFLSFTHLTSSKVYSLIDTIRA